MPELGLGTWGLSGEAYGAVEGDQAEEVIRRAFDMGLHLVDAADSYGAGKIEALLGKILEKHADRDKITVVTKIGTDRTTEPPRKRFSAEYLKGAIDRSKKRLKRDRLDVVLLHNPSIDALSVGEAADCMKDLESKGAIKCWGVAAGDAEVARAAMDQGAKVVSLAYNLLHAADLHRVTGDVMVSGAGVLAHSVLSYGVLSGSWGKSRSFREGDHRRDRWSSDELGKRIDQAEGLRFLVQKDVTTLRGAAVRFALTNHVVSSALLGPKSVMQLEQLVRETGGGPIYLPDETMQNLPRQLAKLGLSL